MNKNPIRTQAPARDPLRSGAADGHLPPGRATARRRPPRAPGRGLERPAERAAGTNKPRRQWVRIAAVLAVLVVLVFGIRPSPRTAPHGLDRRRLRQQPRNFRGPARSGPGDEGSGRRQQSRAARRFAGPARQGALHDSGRIEAGGGRHGQDERSAGRGSSAGHVAQARSNRFRLEHAIEDVNNQLASLRAKVAQLEVRKGQSGVRGAAISPALNRWSAKGRSARKISTRPRPRWMSPRIRWRPPSRISSRSG